MDMEDTVDSDSGATSVATVCDWGEVGVSNITEMTDIKV
jgi:hypothetical protein